MSRVEHLAEGVTLYCGDARDIVPEIERVRCVVTSPPYGKQRDYGAKISDWRQLVSGVLSGVKDSGDTQLLINLGLVHSDGAVDVYWGGFLDDMADANWRLFGWYVWDHGSGMAGDWNGRLAPSFEFVFHFNRTPRAVNKTKPTLGGKIHGPNIRNADGTANAKSHEGRPVNPTKIPDNVIRVPRETSGGFAAAHPARFPEAFARELVEPFSAIGELVLDPFLGSGTTGVAAVKLGRQFTGIEIDPGYFDIACRRIAAALKEPDLFIEAPQPMKQEALPL